MEDLDYTPNPVDHADTVTADTIVNSATQRVGVLVLGMHRSGSSAITRMLSLLGCALPATLMPSAASNPKGHWESDAIASLNDEILTLAGTDWHDWSPVNARLSETLIWPQLIARGRQVLRQEFADAPLFVLKDPRICKLAGFWMEVLAAEKVDVAVALPLRNPIEVAQSLTTRDGIEQFQGLLIWLRHVLSAEAATRGRPRIFADFAALLNNWEGLATRLSDGLELVWPRVSTLSAQEISQFLTPDLRHHISQVEELNDNSAIPSWIRMTYKVLLGWARHGEKSADHAILDQISREFDAAGAAFARPMLNADLAVRRAAQIDAERIAPAEERDALARQLAEVESALNHVSIDRDGRAAERDQLAGHNVALAQERDAIAQRLHEAEAELAQADLERVALSGKRDELAAQGAVLAKERDELAWRLGEVDAELVKACLERDARTVERNELADRGAALAEERNKLAWRLGEVEAELAWARGERDARTAERDQLAGQHTALTEERNKIVWRLGEVEAQLEIAKANDEKGRAYADGLEVDLGKALTSAQEVEHRLAITQSTLRQREEEISQLGAELEATRGAVAQLGTAAHLARHDADRLAQECQSLRGSMAADAEAHSAQTGRLQRELAEAQTARQSAEDQALRAEADREALGQQSAQQSAEAELVQAEVVDVKARLDNRFAEIAKLSQMYRDQEQQVGEYRQQVEWLGHVQASLRSAPGWWWLMPRGWRRRRELIRLQQLQLFDGPAYLARYPDVARAGMDPLRHYVLHGQLEGRKR